MATRFGHPADRGGSLAKFYIVAVGADSQPWLLIQVLVVTSTIGLIYYLRVVTTLFHQPVAKAKGLKLSRTVRWPFRSFWPCSRNF